MTTGQIQAPSAFDLWWEKQRKTVTTLFAVVIVGVLGYYGWQLVHRARVDSIWSEFAQQAGLRAGYAEPGEWAQFASNNPNMWASYVLSTPERLVADLPEHVAAVSDQQFDAAIAQAKGTDREPLLLWLAANSAAANRSYERAKTLLRRLQAEHPKHFLSQESDHPPQHLRDLNEPEPGAKPPDKPHEPKYADPVRGSLVGLALARIEREEKFVAEHATMYTPPQPDGQQVAVVKTDLGEFRIGFFASAAPKHVDTFIQAAKEGYFDNMAVDLIQRQGEQSLRSMPTVEEMHFGLVSTKTEEDRSKWADERNKLDDKDLRQIDFEDSKISHFPMMVAAAAGKEGKSLPTRIYINVNDASATYDGRRVVFGKVIAGEDVVRRIVLDQVFASEDERRSGRGTPRDTIRIQSVTIE